MRVTLDRDGPLYKAIYKQRTSTERINSQSKALGIKRPKVRNIRSVRNLNTLTYLVINARALQRARELNASLLTTQKGAQEAASRQGNPVLIPHLRGHRRALLAAVAKPQMLL